MWSRSSQGSPLAPVAAGFLNRIVLVSSSRAAIPDAKLSYLTTVGLCVGLWCAFVLASATTEHSYLESERWNTVTPPALPFAICPLCPSFFLSIHHTPQLPFFRDLRYTAKIITACQRLACDKLEDFLFLISLTHRKADMIDTHLEFWLLCCAQILVGVTSYILIREQGSAEGVEADTVQLFWRGTWLACSSVIAHKTQRLIKCIWGNVA